jgi:hypothetical protein
MQDKELTLRAADLARAAPNSWNAFLHALEGTAGRLNIELVSWSEPRTIQVAQGRAQLCASLLTLFANAVKDADGKFSKRV